MKKLAGVIVATLVLGMSGPALAKRGGGDDDRGCAPHYRLVVERDTFRLCVFPK